MDTAGYLRYRRRGGRRPFLAWELSSGLAGYADAPAPAKLGYRLASRAGYELPPETAPLTNCIVYFAHAASWGLAYAILVRRPRIEHDLAVGAAYWAAGWTALQAAGLYRPIGAYPARVVVRDLATHLAFGLGAGTTLRTLRRGAERRRGTGR